MSALGDRRESSEARQLHLICERDVGLFSLIQQVIAHVPWAARAGRIPIVLFGSRCCYWVPGGYRGRTSVWEYYFEPLHPDHPASSVPSDLADAVARRFPDQREVGFRLNESAWVSNNFGDHPHLMGRTLAIPYGWRDPGPGLRARTARVIREHVRPRPHVAEAVERFWRQRMAGFDVVGVHIRGTDAVSIREERAHRKDSLVLDHYREAVDRLLARSRGARVLVATDDQASLDFMRDAYGDRVIDYATHRHRSGEAAGRGPTGALMPAYVAGKPRLAALNGEEAVVEHLLLGRCLALVHNGSSLARTVLLSNPSLPHFNTNRKSRILAYVQTLSAGKLRRTARRSLLRASAAMRRPSPDV